MEYNYFIGIDVSGATLDHVVMRDNVHLFHRLTANDEEAIKAFVTDLKKLKGFTFKTSVFCMENTGIFCQHLINVLYPMKANIVIENPIHIKNSLGFQRNKSDKLDAARIAEYAYRSREYLRLWVPRREEINTLAELTSLRSRLSILYTALRTPISQEKKFFQLQTKSLRAPLCSTTMKGMETDMKAIEKAIMQIIKNDQQLYRYFRIITSVPCIGPVTAWEILITTNEFKDINNPKKFACYSGVAPFQNESGVVKKTARVSPAANKKMKSLMHICALTATFVEGDLKTYRERKRAEGKPKMAVINALRYKLILRIFACISQDRLYDPHYVRPVYNCQAQPKPSPDNTSSLFV